MNKQSTTETAPTYFIVDLSFIPEELLNKELSSFQYQVIKISGNNTASADRATGGTNKSIIEELKMVLRDFALEQYLNNNTKLAKGCYDYLLLLCEDHSKEKAYLSMLYDVFFSEINGELSLRY